MRKPKRTTYTYEYRVNRRVSHRGVTGNPKRRLAEHRRRRPGGTMSIIGRAKTRQGALCWERRQRRTRGYYA